MGGYGKANIMEKKGLDLLTEEGRILLKNLYSFSESTLLALTLVGECFNQFIEGQVAKANVIKNRVRYWRKSYQEIILQCNDEGVFQFTCWKDKGEWLFDIWKGTIILNEYEKGILRQIFYIAEGICGNRILSNVKRSDHYHTNWVRPWWGIKMKKIVTIGDHVFLESDRVR